MRGATCQGYKDDSCWARGQAWGVYGTAISYRYTKARSIWRFRQVLSYYLDRLPEDLIPYWDMIFTRKAASRGTPPRHPSWPAACWRRPSTPTPIRLRSTRCWRRRCWAAWPSIMPSGRGPWASALLRHGTYSKKSPYNTCTPEGVDECVSWGDYFYMEGLTRLTKDWTLYW